MKSGTKEYNKWYYSQNKEAAKMRAKKWQSLNPEKYRENSRNAEKKFLRTPKGIYSIIKSNSRVKKYGEIITQGAFIDWYESKEKVCEYCGKVQEDSPRLEIDRMDNSKGYVTGNMTLACKECNGVKGNILSYDEMKIVGEVVMKKRKTLCS